MSFDPDRFVDDVREANRRQNPDAAIRELLRRTIAEPSGIAEGLPESQYDELLLFEDDEISIWRCQFEPHVVLPPHEHKITVHIGACSGVERSLLFKRGGAGLCFLGEKVARTGEVISLGPEAIHAVTANGGECSLALHVYRGPLMALERSLFDWETGEEIEFTLDNLVKLKRPSNRIEPFLKA